jgi:transposase
MDEAPGWFLGIDWATEAHDICLLDGRGVVHWERRVPHEPDAVARLLDELLAYTGSGAEGVAVAIETPRGALVDALVDRGFPVGAVNPKQLDRFRDRFSVAGAKDDRRDAQVLADSRRTDPRAFHQVSVNDPLIVYLREMTRTEQDLQTQLGRLTNRLWEQVHRLAPSLLRLSPAADEPWFWTLLEQISPPPGHQALTRSDVRALLKAHRIRRWNAEDVLQAVQEPRFSLAPGVPEAIWAVIGLLLPQLRVINAQRRRCISGIEQALAQLAERPESEAEPGEHRDVTILQSMPGAGRTVIATMFAEAAAALAQRDYGTLRIRLGVAPVTRKSGKRVKRPTVSMRYACSHPLRNAAYHWGRASLQHDSVCRRYYDELRGRGHTHGRALRSVVDRWLRILVAMLTSRTLYDPARFEREAVTAA